MLKTTKGAASHSYMSMVQSCEGRCPTPERHSRQLDSWDRHKRELRHALDMLASGRLLKGDSRKMEMVPTLPGHVWRGRAVEVGGSRKSSRRHWRTLNLNLTRAAP